MLKAICNNIARLITTKYLYFRHLRQEQNIEHLRRPNPFTEQIYTKQIQCSFSTKRLLVQRDTFLNLFMLCKHQRKAIALLPPVVIATTSNSRKIPIHFLSRIKHCLPPTYHVLNMLVQEFSLSNCYQQQNIIPACNRIFLLRYILKWTAYNVFLKNSFPRVRISSAHQL